MPSLQSVSIPAAHATKTNTPQIIAESTSVAYKGAPYDIQQKLRRVIEVWRQRVIFDPPVQDQIERNLDGSPPRTLLYHDVD